MAKTGQQTVKRQRTCIACGAQDDKRGLLRIVRTPSGVAFDATGRVAGRGAYVCSPACFEVASRQGKLSRALRVKVTQEDIARIASELAPLHEEVQG